MRQSTIVEYQSDDEAPWRNESLLRELYLTQELTTYEIADELNCHPSTVQEWIREFGIPTRGPNGTKPDAEYKDESFLREQYISNEMSAYEIAEEFDVVTNTIYTWLEKHGIDRRAPASGVNKNAPYTDESWLKRKYQEEDMSSLEIAEIAGVHPATIQTWLHRLDIEVDDEGRNPLPYASFYMDSNGYEAWRGWTPGENKQEQVMVHRLLAVAHHGIDAVSGMHVHHKNGERVIELFTHYSQSDYCYNGLLV